jgi:heme/copper-type cytochrome/quinol oxidase subunit 2
MKKSELRIERNYYYLLIIFSLVYLALTLFTPPDSKGLERYGLTEFNAKLIGLTFVIPLIAIWYTAIYGFIKLRSYAQSIRDSKDGQALMTMTQGLLVLSLGLPISSLISSFFTLLVRNNLIPLFVQTITSSYVSIIISVIAYWFLFFGSKKLYELAKKKKVKAGNKLFFWLFLIPTVIAYVYLVIDSRVTGVSAQSNPPAIDLLPIPVVFLTIVFPYILAWFLGYKAAFNILSYKDTINGSIYKKALSFLALGIVSLIFSSIFIQFLTASSQLWQHLKLGPLLGVIYLLLIVIAAGYLFIAYGAKRLKKIEEV